MSLIYKHPTTQGEIHQVGFSEIPRKLNNNNFKLIILAAEELQPRFLTSKLPLANRRFLSADKIYAPMKDTIFLSDKEIKEFIKKSKKAASRVVGGVLDGKNVLVTCKAGWNRSGLITALSLKKLTKQPAKKIIGHIRKRRSLFALSNPLFVQIIENL